MPYGGVVQTKHIIQEPLEDWYNEKGNIVLMGEAAHVLNVRMCGIPVCLKFDSLRLACSQAHYMGRLYASKTQQSSAAFSLIYNTATKYPNSSQLTRNFAVSDAKLLESLNT